MALEILGKTVRLLCRLPLATVTVIACAGCMDRPTIEPDLDARESTADRIQRLLNGIKTFISKEDLRVIVNRASSPIVFSYELHDIGLGGAQYLYLLSDHAPEVRVDVATNIVNVGGKSMNMVCYACVEVECKTNSRNTWIEFGPFWRPSPNEADIVDFLPVGDADE